MPASLRRACAAPVSGGHALNCNCHMGVGLFISRWIIQNHRGAISAALNDGPGATFSFSIPC